MSDTTPVPTGEPKTAALPASLVRTLVPFVAGVLGVFLLELVGLPVDDPLTVSLATAVVGYLYYVVVRFLEVFVSGRWGYVLGVKGAPTYNPTPTGPPAGPLGR